MRTFHFIKESRSKTSPLAFQAPSPEVDRNPSTSKRILLETIRDYRRGAPCNGRGPHGRTPRISHHPGRRFNWSLALVPVVFRPAVSFLLWRMKTVGFSLRRPLTVLACDSRRRRSSSTRFPSRHRCLICRTGLSAAWLQVRVSVGMRSSRYTSTVSNAYQVN